MSEPKAVKFKLVGPNKGKTVKLGANKQYHFVNGVLEFECQEDDAKKHAHILKKYYSAVRVKPEGHEEPAPSEDLLPDADDVGEDEDEDKSKSDKPAKADKKA
jgi:hypothetical protein